MSKVFFVTGAGRGMGTDIARAAPRQMEHSSYCPSAQTTR